MNLDEIIRWQNSLIQKETTMPKSAKPDAVETVYEWPTDVMAGDEVPAMIDSLWRAHYKDKPANLFRCVLRTEGDSVDWKTKVVAVPKALQGLWKAAKYIVVDWTWWLSAEGADRLATIHAAMAKIAGEKPVLLYPSVVRAHGVHEDDQERVVRVAAEQLNLPGFTDEPEEVEAEMASAVEDNLEPTPIETGQNVDEEFTEHAEAAEKHYAAC